MHYEVASLHLDLLESVILKHVFKVSVDAFIFCCLVDFKLMYSL